MLQFCNTILRPTTICNMQDIKSDLCGTLSIMAGRWSWFEAATNSAFASNCWLNLCSILNNFRQTKRSTFRADQCSKEFFLRERTRRALAMTHWHLQSGNCSQFFLPLFAPSRKISNKFWKGSSSALSRSLSIWDGMKVSAKPPDQFRKIANVFLFRQFQFRVRWALSKHAPSSGCFNSGGESVWQAYLCCTNLLWMLPSDPCRKLVHPRLLCRLQKREKSQDQWTQKYFLPSLRFT